MKTLIIGLGNTVAIHGWALSQATQKPKKCDATGYFLSPDLWSSWMGPCEILRFAQNDNK